MRASLFTAIILGSVGTLATQYVSLRVFAGSNGSGNEEDLLFMEGKDGCAYNAGGNSFGNVNWNSGVCNGATIITWSGNNCRGSSSQYQNPPSNGIYNVPFASIEARCN